MENTQEYKILPSRIKKELKFLLNNNNPDFTFVIDPTNLRYVFVTMK
jgi:hypothetical protein